MTNKIRAIFVIRFKVVSVCPFLLCISLRKLTHTRPVNAGCPGEAGEGEDKDAGYSSHPL